MFTARPDLRGHVDAVAIHPYAVHAEMATGHVLALRSTLDELGAGAAGLPITEIGWHTRGSGHGTRVSDATRASYLAALTERFARSDCGVWTFMPHTWATLEQNAVRGGDWFGLWGRDDAQPNETGRAYRDTLERIGGPRPDVALCGRQHQVEVASSSSRISRIVRRRSSRTGRVTRVRRRYRRSCHVATVSVAGAPLADGRVVFEYFERRDGELVTRAVQRTTDAGGSAHVCRSRRVGERSRRPLSLRVVRATHPDVAGEQSAPGGLRLP